MKQKIRIAAGQGFWGDLPDAPVRQVEGGPIDYLMLDYLAEVTMSIMQKQKARDPNAGYAKISCRSCAGFCRLVSSGELKSLPMPVALTFVVVPMP
jgi:hypothetical protein